MFTRRLCRWNGKITWWQIEIKNFKNRCGKLKIFNQYSQHSHLQFMYGPISNLYFVPFSLNWRIWSELAFLMIFALGSGWNVLTLSWNPRNVSQEVGTTNGCLRQRRTLFVLLRSKLAWIYWGLYRIINIMINKMLMGWVLLKLMRRISTK